LARALAAAFRVSATDWKEGGWDLVNDRIEPDLKTVDVDLIDVSSGGLVRA